MNPPDDKPAYGPKNPFPAKLLERRLLGSPQSGRKTFHIALSLEPGGPAYSCGDTLGVLAQNDAALVGQFLAVAGLSGDEPVTPPRATAPMPLREALRTKLFIEGKPTPTLVAAAASVSSSPSDRAALEQIAALPTPAYAEFAAQRRVMDFLVEFPSAKFDAATLVKSLQPLNPRLYSIASAPSASSGVVELAVALVEYPLNGRTVRGVASSFLCEDLRPGTGLLPVFAAKGTLRLPVPESDLVMIGPGTGIAPFRAFLKEREVTQAKGRNWLFYGHRKESEDFYYKDEVLAWQASGLLNKLSLAWSREGAHKRYVQHLMLEHRDELWAWFEAGATIAICGNRDHMARDVEAALLQIAAEKGACEASPEGASAWLKSMKASKRIQEDVY